MAGKEKWRNKSSRAPLCLSVVTCCTSTAVSKSTQFSSLHSSNSWKRDWPLEQSTRGPHVPTQPLDLPLDQAAFQDSGERCVWKKPYRPSTTVTTNNSLIVSKIQQISALLKTTYHLFSFPLCIGAKGIWRSPQSGWNRSCHASHGLLRGGRNLPARAGQEKSEEPRAMRASSLTRAAAHTESSQNGGLMFEGSHWKLFLFFLKQCYTSGASFFIHSFFLYISFVN